MLSFKKSCIITLTKPCQLSIQVISLLISWLMWKVFMHKTFSFALLHCYSAMDVYKYKCNTATNTQIIQIWVSRVDPICCWYIDPVERVWYITCRLTSDISTKEFQHYCKPSTNSTTIHQSTTSIPLCCCAKGGLPTIYHKGMSISMEAPLKLLVVL